VVKELLKATDRCCDTAVNDRPGPAFQSETEVNIITSLRDLFAHSIGEIQTVHGWSLLHWACRTADSSLIDLLLESGLEDSVKTTSDPPGLWSAYTIAAFHRNKQLAGPDTDNINGQANFSAPRLLQPINTPRQGQYHPRFLCDGCKFVRDPNEWMSVTNIVGNLRPTFSLSVLL
jgi:ankyrin repeat protein